MHYASMFANMLNEVFIIIILEDSFEKVSFHGLYLFIVYFSIFEVMVELLANINLHYG